MLTHVCLDALLPLCEQGRLGKQYGSGLPSLLACLKGLRRAGTALIERHFFCYVVR